MCVCICAQLRLIFFNQSPFVQILLNKKKRQTDKKATKKHLNLPLVSVSEVMTEVAASRNPDELDLDVHDLKSLRKYSY